MPKPFVTINLDRPRRLRYTMNALISMEEALGKPIGQLISDYNTGTIGFKDMRIIIWAGLLHENPDLTLEQVGDMIDEAESLKYVMLKAGEALRTTFGDDKETAKKNKKGPTVEANGIGTELSN